jgi:tetratricopeptide (TPR) repeat protein
MAADRMSDGKLSPVSAKGFTIPLWFVWSFIGIVAAVVVMIVFVWKTRPTVSESRTIPEQADAYEVTGANPGYMGAEACASCHAERVAEFRKTRHFQACRLPLAEATPSGFTSAPQSLSVRDGQFRFEMKRQGEEFIQTAIRSSPGDEQRTSARIDLVYGTGNADAIFFTWRGDRLYELPAAWLYPQNRWAASPFNPYGSGSFTRETTPRCVECHNTWAEHVPGSTNQFRPESFLLGITCEKCHGPGRDHVTFHQADPQAESAHAIVHPGKLSRDRQMDLCGQCHSNTVRRLGPAFSYRPGEPLDNYFRTSLNKRQEEDHVANQVRYMRESKCFQKNDKLTCLTCHNPHRPSSCNEVANACLKCHKADNCGEHKRLPIAVRSQCVDCHMPRFTRIQVFFETENDQYVPAIRPHQHRIGVYPIARQETLVNWYRSQTDSANRLEADRLTKTLADHWVEESSKFRREHRFVAAIGALREALRIDDSPAMRARLREVVAIQRKIDIGLFAAQYQMDERKYPEATETLDNLLTIKPDLAKAHGKLGTLCAIQGKNDEATKHLQAVAQFDPDDAYGYGMLGWLAYLQGKPEEAVKAYRQADAIEPFNAKTNYHLGLALAQMGSTGEAGATFKRVLTIDPDHAGACQGLSHALRGTGLDAECLRYAVRAAKLTNYQNADILLSLVDAYAVLGQFADAEETAEKALAVAKANGTDIIPQIESRLREIRSQTGLRHRP